MMEIAPTRHRDAAPHPITYDSNCLRRSAAPAHAHHGKANACSALVDNLEQPSASSALQVSLVRDSRSTAPSFSRT